MLLIHQNPQLEDALQAAADKEQEANASLELSDAPRRNVFQNVMDFVVAGSILDDQAVGRTQYPRSAKISAAGKYTSAQAASVIKAPAADLPPSLKSQPTTPNAIKGKTATPNSRSGKGGRSGGKKVTLFNIPGSEDNAASRLQSPIQMPPGWVSYIGKTDGRKYYWHPQLCKKARVEPPTRANQFLDDDFSADDFSTDSATSFSYNISSSRAYRGSSKES